MSTTPTPAKTPGRILVVDDEALVRDSMRRMLMVYGHEVETSPGGPEALARLAEEQFDLVIIDYFMPVMKGNELAALIRARNAGQRIIMISASAELLQAFGAASSADLLIGKPIQLDELGEVVARALYSAGPLQAAPQP